MEDLILKSNQKTISSIEISELTGKRHDNIMRDIKAIIEQGVDALNFEVGIYLDKNNQRRPCYHLTQKGCLILASGYDALLREKIINRWEELEKKEQSSSQQIPQSFADALRLAAAQAEEIEQQQRLLQEQAPKVIFADAVSCSDKDILIGELATILNQNKVDIGQNRLFIFLRENGYLCTSGEKYNLPSQRSMDMSLFRVKKTTILQPDGTVRVSNTTKVTPQGQKYFVNKFLKQCEQATK